MVQQEGFLPHLPGYVETAMILGDTVAAASHRKDLSIGDHVTLHLAYELIQGGSDHLRKLVQNGKDGSFGYTAGEISDAQINHAGIVMGSMILGLHDFQRNGIMNLGVIGCFYDNATYGTSYYIENLPKRGFIEPTQSQFRQFFADLELEKDFSQFFQFGGYTMPKELRDLYFRLAPNQQTRDTVWTTILPVYTARWQFLHGSLVSFDQRVEKMNL